MDSPNPFFLSSNGKSYLVKMKRLDTKMKKNKFSSRKDERRRRSSHSHYHTPGYVPTAKEVIQNAERVKNEEELRVKQISEQRSRAQENFITEKIERMIPNLAKKCLDKGVTETCFRFNYGKLTETESTIEIINKVAGKYGFEIVRNRKFCGGNHIPGKSTNKRYFACVILLIPIFNLCVYDNTKYYYNHLVFRAKEN